MNKIIEYIKNNRKIHYIILIIVTCIIAIPIFSLQLLDTHDGKGHISRVIATNIAIHDTNFPHLLTPNTVDSVFGYAINLFYGKLPVYSVLILKMLPITYVNALKLFAILTIFLSGITMYHCVFQMTKKRTSAIICAILYMTTNYRFEEIYTRFALGEFVTFVFLPMILQGIYTILYEDGKKSWILGLGITALLLSHSITTLYFGIFCFLYILLQGKKVWKKIIWKQILMQIFFAIVLTAFFTIPIIEHKIASNYAIFEPNTMGTNIETILKCAVEMKKMFIEDRSVVDIDMRMGIPIGICFLISLCIIKKMPQKIKDIWIGCACLGIVALFMCTKYFPWLIMPDILYTIQFPWRLTGIAAFFLSISAGIGITYFIENCRKEWIKSGMYISIIAIIIMHAILYANTYHWNSSDADRLYEQKILNHQFDKDTYLNWDYLPIKAYNKHSLSRNNKIDVLEGTSKISKEEKNGLEMKFTIKDGTKDDTIELPYLFYLGYEIELKTNEKSWKLEAYESKNGFIQISLPEDITEGEAVVQYKGTVIEKIGYGISFIGVIAFVIYIRFNRKI